MTPQKHEQPLITIGITCYNAERYIERAINSAVQQCWPNTEILVVDDASTDNSAAVVQKLLLGRSNARLIQKSINGGVAAARNTLLSEAAGEYIAFFDDDDESLPERVTVQYNRIIDHLKFGDGAVLCFASGQRTYPNGYTRISNAIGAHGRAPVDDELVEYLLFNKRAPDVYYGSGVPSCALMAPIRALQEVGGYDESLGRVEDVDIAIRLAFRNVRIIGCPERLYQQYATLGADKTPAKNLEAELKIVRKHQAWLESKYLYRHSKDWFKFREAWFSGRKAEATFRVLAIFVRNPFFTCQRLLRSGPARLVHEQRMAKHSIELRS